MQEPNKKIGHSEKSSAEDIEAAKQEVAKLLPGAVIVSAMKFRGGTERELINWLKEEGYKFPVLAVVDNLVPMDLIDVMCDWGAEHNPVSGYQQATR